MTSESSMAFSDDGFAGGLSDPLSAQYKHRRSVLDLVDKLHSYGLQRQLDLPQIAVVGSQSVGKSSLIESISGVKSLTDCVCGSPCLGLEELVLGLPHLHPPRCPIECRLSRSTSSWTCEVYLRVERQITEIPFGPRINDKSEVEDRIRRAQLAILNPSKEPLEFLGPTGDVDTGARNELSFSSDLVSVRISGKETDELSFVDLPGIIASVRQGDNESDIEEVKNLVRNVIMRPSCLILLVISCDTDIENQGARRLAKEVDRSGNRTIPVLTKPDRIATREHSTWLSLLSNSSEHYRHGWHCVKQSDQQQLENHISWQAARDNEVEFFDRTDPWNTLDDSLRLRLGMRFLTDALGRILFELICKRLPDLLAEVENKVQRIKEALSLLPTKLTGDPTMTMITMIEAFKQDVELLVKGRAEDGKEGLIQSIRRSKETFREAVFRQAPEFKPFEKPRSTEPPPEQLIDELVAISPGEVAEEDLEPKGRRSLKALVYMDEVLEKAQDAITRELPNHCPYDVNVYFVKRFTEKWHEPAGKLFEDSKRLFTKELKTLVSRHFSEFATGGLEHTVLRTVLNELESSSKKTQKRMNDCIALEREEPATVNDHYLSDYKRKFHSRYTAARRLYVKQRPNLQKFLDGGFQGTDEMNNALHNLSQMGFEGLKKEELLRLLPADKADAAIEIMSEVRAYYQVAFKRFVDNIPMIIDFELLKGFNRTLTGALFQGLQVTGEEAQERATHYLEEDPNIIQRRDTLEKDLEKFGAALADLQDIPGVNSNSGHASDLDGDADLSD